jgi:hypothetical protein
MSDPTNRSVSDWLADLEISEAQAAAGNVVPAEAVLARLRDNLAKLEADHEPPAQRKVAPRR